MQTIRNKIVRGIKILANGRLYHAVLVLVGLNCFDTKKEITTIKLTPKKEKLIITDADNNVWGQPNAEEVCAVPKQQPNVLQAGLKGSNKINQNLDLEESGDPSSSSRLGQLNKGVNNQSPITSGAFKRNTYDGNKEVNNGQLDNVQGKDTKLNEQPSNLKPSVELSKETKRGNTSLNQNLSLLLQDFKKEMDLREGIKENLKSTLISLCKKGKHKKLLKEIKQIDYFFDANNLALDKILPLKLHNQSKEAQEEYKADSIKVADWYIEELKEHIRKIQTKRCK